MSRYRLAEKLTSIIRLLVDYPQGLSILLGGAPPLSCDEINEMFETIRPPCEPTLDQAGCFLRVDGGADHIEADMMIDSADSFNRVIGCSGGWAHINAVTRGWKAHYPLRWGILVDYVVWAGRGASRIDGSQVKKVAGKFHVSHTTVVQTAQEFPRRIATAILTSPNGEKYELIPAENIKAVGMKLE